MIIKNNFNSKDANSNNEYHALGKGSNSLDKKYEMNRDGYIKENNDNKIIRDIINSDHEFNDDDNDNEDKWDFFR